MIRLRAAATTWLLFYITPLAREPAIRQTSSLGPPAYDSSKGGVVIRFLVDQRLCHDREMVRVDLRIADQAGTERGVPLLVSPVSKSEQPQRPLTSLLLRCGSHVAFWPDPSRELPATPSEVFVFRIFIDGALSVSRQGPIHYSSGEGIALSPARRH
jgi:hypothetical protein